MACNHCHKSSANTSYIIFSTSRSTVNSFGKHIEKKFPLAWDKAADESVRIWTAIPKSQSLISSLLVKRMFAGLISLWYCIFCFCVGSLHCLIWVISALNIWDSNFCLYSQVLEFYQKKEPASKYLIIIISLAFESSFTKPKNWIIRG